MRPAGIVILYLSLAALGVNGLVGASVSFSNAGELVPLASGFISLAYGLAAISAAVGIWRLQYWGVVALRAWFASCFIWLTSFVPQYGTEPPALARVAVFCVVVLVLFLIVDRYARSKLEST